MVCWIQQNFHNVIKDRHHHPLLRDYVRLQIQMNSDCSNLACGNQSHLNQVTAFLIPLITRMTLYTYCKRRNEELQREEDYFKKARESFRRSSARLRKASQGSQGAQVVSLLPTPGPSHNQLPSSSRTNNPAPKQQVTYQSNASQPSTVNPYQAPWSNEDTCCSYRGQVVKAFNKPKATCHLSIEE